MKKVIVYPGRFQPMLAHHAEVFQRLQAAHPDATVYIGTSNKVVPPDSPFNFSEKQQIAQAHGILADRVLQVRSPYNRDDYPFDQKTTQLIIAVGEKDMQRFPFNNTDSQTGLDMNAKGEPRYLQSIQVLDQNPAQSMDQHAYVLVTPNVQTGDKISSASAFREAIRNAPDLETAKQVYTEQFGEYNDQLFTMIYNRLTQGNDNMNEQMNIMRRLAGMPIQESKFQKGDLVTVPGKDFTGEIIGINDSHGLATVAWHVKATSYHTTEKVSALQKADEKKIQEGAPVSFYAGTTDQEKQLALWGRTLMHHATLTKDTEFSNTMATVGNLLTRWGTPGGPETQQDIEQRAGITTDMLEKFLEFAEKHQDNLPEVPDPKDSDDQDDEDLEEAGYRKPMSYHDQLGRWDDSFERGQRAAKDNFKRREMEYELRGEEEAYRRAMRGPFYIMRDDKIIRDKSGNPFVFHTKDAATKAAQTMMQKPWNAGKKFYLTKTLDEQDQAFLNANDLQEDASDLDPNMNHAARDMAEEFVDKWYDSGLFDDDQIDNYDYESMKAVSEILGGGPTDSEEFQDTKSDFDYYVKQAVEMHQSDSDDEYVMPDGDYEDESDSDEDYIMPNESVAEGEYYVDHDQDSGYHCIFHTDKGDGHAYASYASKEEAEAACDKMNQGMAEGELDEKVSNLTALKIFKPHFRDAAEQFVRKFGDLINNPDRSEEYEYQANRAVAELLGNIPGLNMSMADINHDDLIDARSDFDYYVEQMSKEAVAEGEASVLEDSDSSPVANAIINRISRARTDLLKHGLQKVMDAVEEVADYVGDVEEIGSSDVSGWIKQVEEILGHKNVEESTDHDMLKLLKLSGLE